MKFDIIKKAKQYNQEKVECIDVIKDLSFTIGSAIKYFWRRNYKNKPLEDLQKCLYYLDICGDFSIKLKKKLKDKTLEYFLECSMEDKVLLVKTLIEDLKGIK